MPEFDEIIAAHADAVWQTVMRLLDHEQDALDCYQQTFLEATRLPRNSVGNWSALLRSIATRRAMDLLRKRYLHRQTFEPWQVEPSVEVPPDQNLIDEQLRDQIRRGLASLPEQQATAFWLRHLEQLSPGEIAGRLGIESGHVRVLVHRAIQHLRKEMSQEFLESPKG